MPSSPRQLLQTPRQPSSWPSRVWKHWLIRSDTFSVYVMPDAESAEIRAAHLQALLRLTPLLMAANVLNGMLVAWAFYPDPPSGLWLWLACLCGLAVSGANGYRRFRVRRPTAISPRGITRATRHACALAIVWGVAPALWFAEAEPLHQMLIIALTASMLSAGAFTMSPVPTASIGYAGILSLALLVALWRPGDPVLFVLSMLLICYATVVIFGALESARKATALLRSQREARRQERSIALLLQDFEDHASEALWQTRADGCLTHVSSRLAQLLGGTVDSLTRQSLLEVLAGRSPEAADALARALATNASFRDLRLPLPDGEQERWWSMSGKRLVDEHGVAIGWRGVLADITTDVVAQQRLEVLAHTDSLTGLANRLTLRTALDAALIDDAPGALLSIDLDHFKEINDSLGHSAGDAVLCAVARRLQRCVRPHDLVARLGGDEFAILYRSSGRADLVSSLAGRLVQSLGQAIDVDGRQLRVGASIGVAPWRKRSRRTEPVLADSLLSQADQALYEAKGSGRGQFMFYSSALGERSRRRSAIENGLRQAIERDELSLHWQPKVSIDRWQIVGAEALLRWRHPKLGPIGPAEFVPLAEQSGMIDEIGAWALREACHAAAGPLHGLAVSVNVSAMQLHDGEYTQHVRDALASSGLDPSYLELEITESVFIDDAEGALAQLNALRDLGVRIALDDFGTGYSSLSYLRRFPFHTLKIDRSFVRELLERGDARAIVRMMTELAAELGMRTVAEGVESRRQLDAVAAAGCREVQGFVVSRPRALDRFAGFYREWDARPPRMSSAAAQLPH